MRKFILLTAFMFVALTAFSQTCPIITYTYDAAGNRVARQLVLKPCNNPPNSLKRKDSGSDLVHTNADTVMASTISVNVYPNPASDKIIVELGLLEKIEESTVLLFDLNGKIIHSEVTTLGILPIDVTNLVPGVYYMRITRGGKCVGYNVMKN